MSSLSGGAVGSAKAVLPKFDGSKDKFQMWWVKVRAYCAYVDCVQAIQSVVDPDLPATESEEIDITTEEGKKKFKAKKANSTAMSSLTMAFETNSLISMVFESSTRAWPNGLAWILVKKLMKKYMPKDLCPELN